MQGFTRALHNVVTLQDLQVIPMLQGDATEQTPPDLPSFLFKERIVYLVSNFSALPADLFMACRTDQQVLLHMHRV